MVEAATFATKEMGSPFENIWVQLSKDAQDIAYFLASSGNLVDNEVLPIYLRLDQDEFKKAVIEIDNSGFLLSTTYREELEKAERGEKTILTEIGIQWSSVQARSILSRPESQEFFNKPHYYFSDPITEKIISCHQSIKLE